MLHDLSFLLFGLAVVNFLLSGKGQQEIWLCNEMLEKNSKAAAQSWLNFSETVEE